MTWCGLLFCQINNSKKKQYNAITLSNRRYNCSGPKNLKLKEKDIGLAKTYSITISIQKVNSIQKFVLKIQDFSDS